MLLDIVLRTGKKPMPTRYQHYSIHVGTGDSVSNMALVRYTKMGKN